MWLKKKTKKLIFFRITWENVYSFGFALAPPNLEELTNIGLIFGGANIRFAIYIYIEGGPKVSSLGLPPEQFFCSFFRKY